MLVNWKLQFKKNKSHYIFYFVCFFMISYLNIKQKKSKKLEIYIWIHWSILCLIFSKDRNHLKIKIESFKNWNIRLEFWKHGLENGKPNGTLDGQSCLCDSLRAVLLACSPTQPKANITGPRNWQAILELSVCFCMFLTYM